jgi:hypothetical protein
MASVGSSRLLSPLAANRASGVAQHLKKAVRAGRTWRVYGGSDEGTTNPRFADHSKHLASGGAIEAALAKARGPHGDEVLSLPVVALASSPYWGDPCDDQSDPFRVESKDKSGEVVLERSTAGKIAPSRINP